MQSLPKEDRMIPADDDKVRVKVDADRGHEMFIGPAPDDATLITMTTLVPNATMHLRMTPQVARDIAAALVMFADQSDGAAAIAKWADDADTEGEQFHRGSRA
jgi:hypothetical protein